MGESNIWLHITQLLVPLDLLFQWRKTQKTPRAVPKTSVNVDLPPFPCPSPAAGAYLLLSGNANERHQKWTRLHYCVDGRSVENGWRKFRAAKGSNQSPHVHIWSMNGEPLWNDWNFSSFLSQSVWCWVWCSTTLCHHGVLSLSVDRVTLFMAEGLCGKEWWDDVVPLCLNTARAVDFLKWLNPFLGSTECFHTLLRLGTIQQVGAVGLPFSYRLFAGLESCQGASILHCCSHRSVWLHQNSLENCWLQYLPDCVSIQWNVKVKGMDKR